MTDISKKTIVKVKKIKETAPELINKIREGQLSINKAYNQVIRTEQRKTLEESAKQIDYIPDESIKLYNCDFKELNIADNSIDLILTDPPYPEEFLPLWDDLGNFAKAKLKNNGYLVAYSGQYHLPEIFKMLKNHLDYIWTFCLYHVGQTQIVNGVNVINRWKPVLIFQNGKTKFKETKQDYVISERSEKKGHDWQQSESGVKKLIEIFSNIGDIVCDPFMGSGTTAVICKQLKRKFVGAEIEQTTYQIALKRIQNKNFIW